MTDLRIRVKALGSASEARKLLSSNRFRRILATRLKDAVKDASKLFWIAIRKSIITRGRSSGKPFIPIRPATAAAKGHNRPLVETKALFNAIRIQNKGINKVFVGVLEGETNKKGDRLEDVATALQSGGVFPLTPEVRKVLIAKGFTPRATTKVYVVPARPFVGPAIETSFPDAVKIGRTAVKAAVDEVTRGATRRRTR